MTAPVVIGKKMGEIFLFFSAFKRHIWDKCRLTQVVTNFHPPVNLFIKNTRDKIFETKKIWENMYENLKLHSTSV
jgi:hypothetical protein